MNPLQQENQLVMYRKSVILRTHARNARLSRCRCTLWDCTWIRYTVTSRKKKKVKKRGQTGVGREREERETDYYSFQACRGEWPGESDG